jgi:hypothetical protein
MKINNYAIILALILLGCTNETGSIRALKASGCTDISLQGYALTGCSDSDSTCTEFKATCNGQHVSGVVGCGLEGFPFAKGCTVRFE